MAEKGDAIVLFLCGADPRHEGPTGLVRSLADPLVSLRKSLGPIRRLLALAVLAYFFSIFLFHMLSWSLSLWRKKLYSRDTSTQDSLFIYSYIIVYSINRCTVSKHNILLSSLKTKIAAMLIKITLGNKHD